MRCDRRSLLRLGLGGTWMLGAGELPAGSASRQLPRLYRWWPRFPIARELWVVPFAGDVEEGMLLESAAGLAARASLHGPWRSLVYEELENDGYRRWFEAYCRAHRPRLLRMSLDEAVTRLVRAGIARGHILYRFETSKRGLHSPGPADESANVATSLAGGLGAVVVSERLAARVEKLGAKRLEDVRDRREAWCLERYPERFSRRVVGTADPKTRNVRSLMIALDAFACCARGEVYQKALQRCAPDSLVLGWGIEGEDVQTLPSSRWGLFQTATNWCHNLPVFAGEAPGSPVPTERLRQKHPVRWWELDWGDGRHHAALVLSDGDNVQWTMGNFTGGPEARYYYGHPERGRIPFGWGLPVPSLAQLSPRTLEEVLQRGTPNDGFVLYSGGGYFFPDAYGQARGSDEALRLHGERLRGYMELTGIRVLAFNFQDWDSERALAACSTLARQMPGLLGILAFQYYPYTAGEGAIRWVEGAGGDPVPVVSCRYSIWAGTGRPRDTTPAQVASALNALPAAGQPSTAECFSWAIVHAWSRFRKARPGEPLNAEETGVSQERDVPGTARGYSPALWAAQRLDPRVRLQTPEELLWRIRLRLRPGATLTRCLREAQAHAGRRPAAPVAGLLVRARALLPRVGQDSAAARECFELLRKAMGPTTAGPRRVP